jgi:hypothetical protein
LRHARRTRTLIGRDASDASGRPAHIQDQLELRRLFDRPIGGPGVLQDLVDENRAPPDLDDVRAIGDQPAGLDILPGFIEGGEPVLGSWLRDSSGATLRDLWCC